MSDPFRRFHWRERMRTKKCLCLLTGKGFFRRPPEYAGLGNKNTAGEDSGSRRAGRSLSRVNHAAVRAGPEDPACAISQSISPDQTNPGGNNDEHHA